MSVVLERGDYFQLRTAIRDIEAIELDAMRTAMYYREQIAKAQQTRNAFFDAIAGRYGLDPAVTYRWDDATCTLFADEKGRADG